MQFFNTLAVLASAASMAVAQRPMNTSICDYYTGALLKQNTPENQYKVLQLVVNTAIIGNYTQPNVGVSVPGILKSGMYMGKEVNLAPYFNGAFASSNRNNKSASVNFLDGGAGKPLMANQLPANGTNELRLVTHLYQYFGVLLGCSGVGKMGFPSYKGSNNMYNVHKFMVLDEAEIGYFISQVGASAQSFGVSMADVKTVGDTLTKTFNYKCSPPAEVIPMTGKMPQSICTDNTCPLDPNAMCSAYPNMGAAVPAPMNTTGGAGAAMNGTGSTGGDDSDSGSGSSGSNGGTPTSSGSGSMMTNSNGAVANGANVAAIAAAALAFAL